MSKKNQKKAPIVTLPKLFYEVMEGTLRYHYDGLSKACASCTLSPMDVLFSWKNEIPSFAECIARHCEKKSNVVYRGKWHLKNMVDADKNAIKVLFHHKRFDEAGGSMIDHPDRNQALITLAMLLHRKEHPLPSSADKDEYGLWPAFLEYYPESASAFDDQPEATAKGKRKRSEASGSKERTVSLLESIQHSLLRIVDILESNVK